MRLPSFRRLPGALLCVVLALAAGAASLLASCGPFSDVNDGVFCPFVLEIYYVGITTGTSPTTYDPAAIVNRLQMSAFLSRAVDALLRRGGQRMPLGHTWAGGVVAGTTLGRTAVNNPIFVKFDGKDLWVTSVSSATVQRVRASDGRLLETWTGAGEVQAVLVAMSRVFAASSGTPGRLFRLDPSQAAGAVTTVASNLGNLPGAMAFDGSRIWTANLESSVSIGTPGPAIPWTVTTVSAGFSEPAGILYDGSAIWVTDDVSGNLYKLASSGSILQTVTVGGGPKYPIFDGTNIWVPNFSDASISVVRAATGSVLATLTGNGLDSPWAAAFDGERILVTNLGNDSVTLWEAAGLTPLGSFSTGAVTTPYGACSDGTSFWIALNDGGALLRF